MAETRQFRIMYVTAPAGSGKTLSRVRFAVDEVLCDTDWVWVSNLPILREPILDRVCRKGKRDRDEISDRIQTIPESELRRWRSGDGGPWDTFSEAGCLEGVYLQIDEIHNFCGKHSKPDVKKKWMLWLGELRHTGCRGIELISQDPSKVAKELVNEASCCLSLQRSDFARDPIFKILLGDWYELRAALITGRYEFAVWEYQKRSMDGRQRVEATFKWRADPEYFKLYDSFSAPQQAAHNQSGGGQQYEFQKRGKLGVCLWFLKRNWWSVGSRAAIALLLVWASLGGGGKVFSYAINAGQGMMSKNGLKPAGSQAEAVTLPPGRVSSTLSAEDAARIAPGTRSALVSSPAERVAELEAQLAAERGRFDALAERVQRSFAVSAISDGTVYFRGGDSYRKGERIEWGPYEGCTVETVDFKRRLVRLDDGRTLRLGLQENKPEPVAVVPGSLPASGGSGGEAAGGDGTSGGSTLDLYNGRHAANRIPPDGDGSLGRSGATDFGSSGGGTGQRAGYAGTPQPASVGSTRSGGSEAWRPASQNRNYILRRPSATGGPGYSSSEGVQASP